MDKKARYKFIYQSLNAAITRAERARENIAKLDTEHNECFCTDDLIRLDTTIEVLKFMHKLYKNRHDRLKEAEK